MYTKSGESEKGNLVKASKQILCSQEKVFVLIWDSEKNCVHRRWTQSYFRFHKKFLSPENPLVIIVVVEEIYSSSAITLLCQI